MPFMDWVHGTLDVGGMVPVIGEVADGVNAGIYAAEGDLLNAGVSLAGMWPFGGQAVTGTRLGVKVGKEILEEAAQKGAKEVAEEAVEQGAKKAGKEAAEEGAEAGAKDVGTKVSEAQPGGGGGGGGSGGGSSGGNGKKSNKLEPDKNAQGDHTTFARDKDGNVYKYETYNKTESGHFNPQQRFDGGKPDGTPGAPHINKHTQQSIPTPHVQGKNIPGGVRGPMPNEIPNNPRFR